MKLALCLVLSACGLAAASDKSPRPAERMSFLENDAIRVGVDLNLGGAITWLSQRGGENIVNNMDLGRQIQMSYYSGPVPFSVGEKKPAKHWEHLGWNPIQAGDDFGHGSRTLDHRNDGKELHTKCVPMQWPLDGVPGDCTFESWITLDGGVVKFRGRINNAREDHTPYRARLQELPAVYVNAPFHKLVSYTGTKPFTNDAVAEIHRPADKPAEWAHWFATERWAALINDEGWGLGLWNPSCVHFIGGFDGKPGPNDTRASATGYIAGQQLLMLDHDIVHEFECELILGSVEKIRERVATHGTKITPPSWDFTSGREGWHIANARDSGWRARELYRLTMEENDPQMISPQFFCLAEHAPKLTIRAAFRTKQKTAQIFWRRLEDGKSVSAGPLNFTVTGDEQMHDYEVRLADSPDWRGAIVELRFDPVPTGAAGEWVDIRSISLGK